MKHEIIIIGKQKNSHSLHTKQMLLCLGTAVCLTFISGCGEPAQTPGGSSPLSSQASDSSSDTDFGESSTENSSKDTTQIAEATTPPDEQSPAKGTRDNTPVCLTPTLGESNVFSNEVATLDASHMEEGYISIQYLGTCEKVKIQITGPDGVTYTYNSESSDFETFPLTAGDGNYSVGVFENISGTQYATSFYQDITLSLANQFGPFLYPNQYVDFNRSSKVVSKAEELAASANSDLDVVSNVYNYVIQNISYDYDKASNISSGYLCKVDETLSSGTGICLDYAAVMSAMLRSQGIPTHLEVGYAQDAYHAWISTYLDEAGWVNGIIEFDGNSWSLMDPTFASNSSEESLKKFIGNGSNYTVKYIY